MQTQPNRERTATEHAQDQGHEVWVPRVKNSRTLRLEPLFPRYVFVQITGAWHHLLSTIGVSNVLRNGDGPAFMPEEGELGWTALRARERNSLIVLPPRRRVPP